MGIPIKNKAALLPWCRGRRGCTAASLKKNSRRETSRWFLTCCQNCLHLALIFYLLKGERDGKIQLTNQQVANSASTVEKPQYLLDVTWRDLFLSEVLVHKKQCIEVAHAAIQQFVWHSGVNLV